MQDRNTYNADKELADRAAAGDRKAFDELVKRYRGKLWNVASRMCGHYDDAQDVLVGAFSRAYSRIEQYRGDASFGTWLFRIAANECMGMRRSSEGRRTDSLDKLADLGVVPEQVMEMSRLPEDEVISGELKDTIDKAAASLPEPMRIVFLLRDVEQFSTEETAQILGLSPAAVKSRLHRARAAIREALRDYPDVLRVRNI